MMIVNLGNVHKCSLTPRQEADALEIDISLLASAYGLCIPQGLALIRSWPWGLVCHGSSPFSCFVSLSARSSCVLMHPSVCISRLAWSVPDRPLVLPHCCVNHIGLSRDGPRYVTEFVITVLLPAEAALRISNAILPLNHVYENTLRCRGNGVKMMYFLSPESS
jgi:hypothetical protein